MYKISYAPFHLQVIEKNLTKVQISKDTGIALNTFVRMKHNQEVSLRVIAQLCEYLNCNIEDIVRIDIAEDVTVEN